MRPSLHPAALTALSCTFLVLNLLAFMTVAAVLPSLIADWDLNNSQAGWLGGVFFAGYVAAVPVVVPLTDRIPPRRFYLAATLVGAVAAIGFALFADGFWTAMVFRFLAGAAVSGAYMPALKALADSLEEPWRSRASSYYTSVFAVGTGLSILVGGAVADVWGWRWSFAAAGLGNVAAFALGWFWLPEGASDPTARRPRLLAQVRQVLRNRAAMAYILAYTGHVWEVFAVRVWAVAYFLWLATRNPAETLFTTPVIVATIVALVGVPVSMWCGERAARARDRRKVLRLVYAVTFAVGCAAATGPLFGLGPNAMVVLFLLYGMAIYGDTGAITAGTISVAEPSVRGMTMAVHTFVGFGGAMLGPAMAGLALDVSGGRNDAGAWCVAWLVAVGGGLFAWVALRLVGKPRG